MIFDLAKDFTDALAAMPREHPKHRTLELFKEALQQESRALLGTQNTVSAMPFPDFLFQQLRNRIYCNSGGQNDPALHWRTEDRAAAYLSHERPRVDSHFVRTFDADPGTQILRFRSTIRFASDGTRLAAAVLRKNVQVFSISDGGDPITLSCLGRAIAVDFSEDGRFLVASGDGGAGSTTGFVQVFDNQAYQSLAHRKVDGVVRDVVTTANDHILACCGNFFREYTMSLELVREWHPYGRHVEYAVARNRDHTLLAIGEYHEDKRPARISVWDAANLNCLAEFEGQKYGILSLAFSEDSALLASGSNHLDSGVVAWSWRCAGNQYDSQLLSNATRQQARLLLQQDSRSRLAGRVVSTLETGDSVASLAFYPGSTWLVAAEGSPNLECDTIDVFDVVGMKPSNVGKLSGHSSVPISVAVDPTGAWVASLHANARIVLWPGDRLKNLAKLPVPRRLSDHSVDDGCELILSRDCEDHGFVYVTETGTGEHALSGHAVPSLRAALDPGKRYVARMYWDELPMNPYLGGNPSVDEPSRNWWTRFQLDTPVRCTLYPFEALLAACSTASGLSDGYSVIEQLDGVSGAVSSRLDPGLHPLNLKLSPDGRWGVSLLKDREGLFGLFEFDDKMEKCRTNRLAWKMSAAAVFVVQDASAYAVAVVRDEVILRLMEPLAAELTVTVDLVGLGSHCGLTVGPILVSRDLVVTVRDHKRIEVLQPESVRQSSEEDWEEVAMRVTNSCEHDSAVRDAAVTPDARLLIVLDAKPSVCVRRMSDWRILCRRPLDREYENVRTSRSDARILLIGGERTLKGVSYCLMDVVEP